MKRRIEALRATLDIEQATLSNCAKNRIAFGAPL